MKLKLNKVNVKKERLKVILYFAGALVAFVLTFFFGLTQVSAALFLAAAFCFLEGCFSLIVFGIGVVQERRDKKECEEKEPSSAQV